MNILITGAGGFLGRNLVENLHAIKENHSRPHLKIGEIFTYDIDSAPESLEQYCREADFVFHLAGVNRPEKQSEFMEGNFGFTRLVLDLLKSTDAPPPVMFASSIQAAQEGRFVGSEYGRSKRAAEELLFSYAQETGSSVLVYRFPNLAGKWIRPNYNSAVGTFCHNVANGLPITVDDPLQELELLFIDDLLEELLDALEGKEHRCEYCGAKAIFQENGQYCAVPVTHRATLGEITKLLYRFHEQPLIMPEIPDGSFEKKLYSMYISYLPQEDVVVPLRTLRDSRGSFTELLRTENAGQFSVNINAPGSAKGQHWHNSKWELFFVISGHGLVRQRKLGSDQVMEFEVSGDRMEAVRILPGYTHQLINLSETEELITVMWANECFDPDRPDTFAKPV